ncbi:MAG TPA: SDR family oxidoreductase, partial [Gemmataceae bacterium]|nr:SDR family oxidoreductase [Gemmataceae bacterium]
MSQICPGRRARSRCRRPGRGRGIAGRPGDRRPRGNDRCKQGADIARLVHNATEAFGPIDLFCSNAGIAVEGGPEVLDADWQRIWQINVMAHVYATRAVLPGMLARAQGYLLHTASAAGLLTLLGSAPYSVTKHAALAFAEWLAITYASAGIKVSCLCPLGVRTNMVASASGGIGTLLREGAIEPE